jgi:hypothetical protein
VCVCVEDRIEYTRIGVEVEIECIGVGVEVEIEAMSVCVEYSDWLWWCSEIYRAGINLYKFLVL